MRIADHPLDARHLRQFLRRPLRITAGDQNARGRIFAMHPADGRPRIAVGLRRNSAGIQDDQVGVLARIGAAKTALGQLRFERRAIGLRRAAAEILDEEPRHPSSLTLFLTEHLY